VWRDGFSDGAFREIVQEIANPLARESPSPTCPKRLDDFGEEDAGDAIVKPYILEGE
jgi:hypothetical protein